MTHANRYITKPSKGFTKMALAFAALLFIAQVSGCASYAPAPEGPLPTSAATVAAPAACQALRQRGGSC